MEQKLFTVRDNRALNETISCMTLVGDTAALTRPGQFVNIMLDGCYLRRPISVADYGDGEMMLIYRAVGRGTRLMRDMKSGVQLDILTGLGNGYDVQTAGEHPLLVGGGVGIPPLYGLCRALIKNGAEVTAVLGFRTEADAFLIEEFRALGAHVIVTTEDGSLGLCGFVTKGMEQVAAAGGYSYVYSCGPEPMLHAVYDRAAKDKVSGQYSFEERMGCGFGACMGCSCKTKYGNKRICRDGPILTGEEIIW